MPELTIETKLNLNGVDIIELSKIIGCQESELENRLKQYSKTALTEFVTMFLGQKVFSRGSDILEYRLYLLVKNVCSGLIPDEQRVCRLFQMTSTNSRSLIRAVMSKYQYLLQDEINNTLKLLIESVKINNEKNELSVGIHNVNLVDEFNKRLIQINSSLPPVRKKQGSVSVYTFKPSSYNELCKEFGVKSKLKG